MSDKPILPLLAPSIRLFLNGPDKEKSVSIKNYLLDLSIKFSVSERFVRKITQYYRAGYTDFLAFAHDLKDFPHDFINKGDLIFFKIKEDFEKSDKNREIYDKEKFEESERQRKEKLRINQEENELRERGKSMFSESLSITSKTTEEAMKVVDNTIILSLGDRFKIDEETGLVNVDSKASEKDFAHALASLSNMNNGTETIKRRTTDLEASIAYNYSLRFPLTWKNLYLDRKSDLQRILPGFRTLQTLAEIGEKPCGPLWLIKNIVQLKVDTVGTKAFIQAKRDGLELFRKFKEENGRLPTTREVNEIVHKVKTAYGVRSKVRPEATAIRLDDDGGIEIIYLFKDDLEEPGTLENYMAVSEVVFDKNWNVFQKNADGIMTLRQPEKMTRAQRERMNDIFSAITPLGSMDDIILKAAKETPQETLDESDNDSEYEEYEYELSDESEVPEY